MHVWIGTKKCVYMCMSEDVHEKDVCAGLCWVHVSESCVVRPVCRDACVQVQA